VTEARSWPRRRVRRTWTAPLRRQRQLDGRDQLVAGERRHPGTDEELVDRDAPGPGRTRRDDAGAIDEERRCRVRRRRRVADIAGERRPVPDLNRPDDRRRFGKGLVVASDPLVGGDVRHDGPGADAEVSLDLADLPVELRDPLEIDDDPRPDRTVAQADDQVGPTREEAGVGTMLGQEGDGVVEVGRPLVREGSHRGA